MAEGSPFWMLQGQRGPGRHIDRDRSAGLPHLVKGFGLRSRNTQNRPAQEGWQFVRRWSESLPVVANLWCSPGPEY